MLKKFSICIFLLITFCIYGAVKVAVGTAPEKYIAEKIGGDQVEVYCVIPEGKNLHDIAITPDMIKNITQCQVFLHTGLLFEKQILKMLRRSNMRTWDISLPVTKIINKNHHEDVHTWFSYNSLEKMANEVRKVLSETDGKNAAYYFQNHVNFREEIFAGRYNAEQKLKSMPHKLFLTHHAAFGYFADEFNLRQYAFEFNGREITPQTLAFLSKFARKYKIKRVFIQSTAPENVRRAIQNAANAIPVIINPSDYDVLNTLNRFTAELEVSFE